MNKTNTPFVFIKVMVLALLFFFASFVAEGYLVSRLSWETSQSKLLTTSILMLTPIAFYKQADLSLNGSNLRWPSGRQMLIIIAVVGLVLVVGISGFITTTERLSDGMLGQRDPQPINILNLVGSCFISPAIETILFVKIFPELFVQCFRSRSLSLGILISSLVFSLCHIPNTPEHFVYFFVSGVVFCYIYFQTKSLIGSFAAHVVINTAVLFLSSVSGGIWATIQAQSAMVAAIVYVLGLVGILGCLYFLTRSATTEDVCV